MTGAIGERQLWVEVRKGRAAHAALLDLFGGFFVT